MSRKTDHKVCAADLENFRDASLSAAVRNKHALKLLTEKETTAPIVEDITSRFFLLLHTVVPISDYRGVSAKFYT